MKRSRFSSLPLQTRMVAASAVLAVLVVGVFLALVLAVSALREATRQEARSKDVTASALTLEKLVLDIETGLRGYVITADKRYLQPYWEARRQLPSSLESCEELASHEPRHRARRVGACRLSGLHRPLRLLSGPLDRATSPPDRRRCEPPRRRRPLAAARARRPRRGGRAHHRLQPDGGEPRERPARARGAERAATRERATEVGARQHRLARVADTPLGGARVHETPADAGLRLRDAPSLPRHRRRAGAPAVGADRRVPRRPPHRGGAVRARRGVGRHGASAS